MMGELAALSTRSPFKLSFSRPLRWSLEGKVIVNVIDS
jgi:hypothetical protein